MKRVYAVGVVIALVVLALGVSAGAMNMKGKTSIEVDVGYDAFAFTGVADWYNAWADVLVNWGWTLVENRAPSNAIPYGAKFRYGLSPTVSLTGSAGTFSSGGRLATSVVWGGSTTADLTVDTTVSSTFFGAGVQVVLVDPPAFNIFAEVEVGSWGVTLQETWRETGDSPSTAERGAGGSTIGGTVGIGGEYFLPNKSISLIGKIVYRVGKLAQIATTRDDMGYSGVGEPYQTVDPATDDLTDMQIDLGGLGARFGICFSIFAKK